jgi:adenylate cyclase
MTSLFTRFIRYIGIFLILLFSTSSVFFSYIERTIPQNNPFKESIQYASFFENRFYDLRMQSKLDRDQLNEDIVLIKVDDESLQKIGSWPVNRETWATMIDKLGEFDAKVIAFDVMFPEEIKSCGEISPDDSFAKSIENFQLQAQRKVILAYTTQDETAQNTFFNEMPEDLYTFILDSTQVNEKASLVVKKVERHTYPIKKLLDAAPDLGFINMLEDTDGVFRHYQIVSNIDGVLYTPSLGLRAYQAFTKSNPKLDIDSSGSALLSINDQKVFVNNRGETKIRWIGSEENFKSISLHKVIDPEIDQEKLKSFFKGKIAYVGSTATGAHDLRNTPVDSKMPGVYAHMNMTNMLMKNFFYQDLYESIKISFLFLFLGTTILIITMFKKNAFLDLFVTVLLVSIVFFVDYNYLLEAGYQIRMFFVIFNLLATYSWVTLLNFNKANEEKKQIKGAFARYVAPTIVDEMIEHPERLKVGGQRMDITCMFSDVRDFTSISEELSANQLAKSLNRYMGEMTDIVFDTNGTLDKYIGDAIVAFWGAPIDIGDHVTQAVDASVKMLEALPKINEEFRRDNLPEFKIGIGLNSGECNVGNMGSDKIFAYTALGDTMNLGARLESSCKYYGAQILISEYTFERMDQSKFVTRLIDNVVVKGKLKPVKVYEVLYDGHHLWENKNLLDVFSVAYECFVKREFKLAQESFNKLLEISPNDPSTLRLLALTNEYIENPPAPEVDHTINTRTDK